MANSLNLISFHHASSLREAAHRPVRLPDLNGIPKDTPCVMHAVDKLEGVKSKLGDRFESTLRTTGPARAFDFTISADRNPNQIDSEGVSSTESGPLGKEQLAEKIVSSFRPEAYNVVHVRAHGHAHEDVMGMPTQDFVAGLKIAAERLGQPIPTLVLESCLMSSLDVLSSMAGSVQTVIASQELLEADALPHRELFQAALGEDMEPDLVAKRMVDAAGDHGGADTLTAFNIQKLSRVEDQMENLKSALDKMPIHNSLRRSIRKSPRFPRRNVETNYRGKLDLRDTGEVLEAVSAHSSPGVKEMAVRLDKALEEATLGQARGRGYEAVSGLSVRTEMVTEQAGWKLSDLLPWS